MQIDGTPQEMVDFLLGIRNRPDEVKCSLQIGSRQLSDQQITKDIQNALHDCLTSEE